MRTKTEYTSDGNYEGHGVATIDAGIYNIKSTTYKGKPAYQVSTLDGSPDIPCTRSIYTDEYGKTARGILVHAGSNTRSKTRPWSLGCVLVWDKQIYDFCDAVGDSGILIIRR